MADKSLIKNLTYGVFGSLTDLILWNIYLVGSSVGKSGPLGVHQAFREADEMLQKYNHQSLTSAWHQLKKKKLLTYQKRKNLYNPIITEFGRQRLDEALPTYHEKRPWDGKIYLITYDIFEKAHKKRNLLRKFLRDLGCKILQESVLLTPYNIRELLNIFVRKNEIPGTIIVSDIGKDGGVGETTIINLITKLYHLENLNERYEIFINKTQQKDQSSKYLIFEYLSILKDDPQLPFELLPQGFLGNQAYQQYKKLQTDYMLSFVRPDKK